MMKPEIPKGGGTCFICKKECKILHYFHDECRQKWFDEDVRN